MAKMYTELTDICLIASLIVLLYNFCMVYWLDGSFLGSGINGRIICVQRKNRDDF